MAKELKAPITLRITAAEVVESQLKPEDLRAIVRADGDGDGIVQCPHCYGGYRGPPQMLE
jgi:hypothetical protein